MILKTLKRWSFNSFIPWVVETFNLSDLLLISTISHPINPNGPIGN